MLFTNLERLECFIRDTHLQVKRIVLKMVNRKPKISRRHVFLKLITGNMSEEEMRELK